MWLQTGMETPCQGNILAAGARVSGRVGVYEQNQLCSRLRGTVYDFPYRQMNPPCLSFHRQSADGLDCWAKENRGQNLVGGSAQFQHLNNMGKPVRRIHRAQLHNMRH